MTAHQVNQFSDNVHPAQRWPVELPTRAGHGDLCLARSVNTEQMHVPIGNEYIPWPNSSSDANNVCAVQST